MGLPTGIDELHKVVVGKGPTVEGGTILDEMPEEP